MLARLRIIITLIISNKDLETSVSNCNWFVRDKPSVYHTAYEPKQNKTFSTMCVNVPV